MFFNRFLKPFLLIGGLVTMYAGIYAINPETAHLIPFAITDITICTYTIGYWYENHKFRKTVSA